MPRLQSPLQIGIAIGAVVLIVGALGFLTWQNFGGESQESKKRAVDTTEMKQASPDDPDAPKPVDIDELADGTISGTLMYPSHGLPPDLEVFAENKDTGTIFSTKDRINDTKYETGVGYNLSVPAGSYYVYGVTSWMKDQRAYYDNFVVCGFTAGTCVNPTDRLVVVVEPGEETKDILVGDWYNTCVVPGGQQPTEKFDKPSC